MRSEKEIKSKIRSIEVELEETIEENRHNKLTHHMQALEWVLGLR